MKSLHHFCAWCGKPVDTLAEHLNDPECIKITNQKKMALAANTPPWPTLEIAETGSFNGTSATYFTGIGASPKPLGPDLETIKGLGAGMFLDKSKHIIGECGGPDIPISSKEAQKYDQGKTDWSLMPWDAVEEINKVLDFGAKKYAAHNWKVDGGFKWTRVFGSLCRHIFAWARGEDLDHESKLPHLAHAGANILFLLHYAKNKTTYPKDDRQK